MRNWRYRRIIVSVAVSCILWVIICHVSEISNEKLFPEEKELQQLFDSGVSNRSIEVDLKLYIDRVKRMDTKVARQTRSRKPTNPASVILQHQHLRARALRAQRRRLHRSTTPSTKLQNSNSYNRASEHFSPSQRRTSGELWPKARHHQRSNITYAIDVSKLKVAHAYRHCDILVSAIKRLQAKANEEFANAPRIKDPHYVIVQLKNIQCSAYPSFSMDESYSLQIRRRNSKLHCNEIWGCLRGLETFLQLLHRKTVHLPVFLNPTDIHDFPRFPHRGILIDSARHFLPVDLLITNLELMAHYKFNILHWHISDDESFPFQSFEFPNITKAAFTKQEVYSQNDVKLIVEKARLFGIRVIIEIDTPGHTRSWRHFLPHITVNCKSGLLNPIAARTYDVIGKLFHEIDALFPDKVLHLGGDEVDYTCWEANAQIQEHLERSGIGDNFAQLLNLYYLRLSTTVKQSTTKDSFMVWQELFEENVELGSDVIIQVWKENSLETLRAATNAGHRVVLSSCWYLNYVSYGTDWYKYYACDPTDFVDSSAVQHLILGGEAALWGEFIDHSNFMPTLWPRALAVAERLWSSKDTVDPFDAAARLDEQLCRMKRRKINAAPVNGAGSCSN